MNSCRYRGCAVLQCKNTSIKTPDKLWIQVPSDLTMRDTWLKLARRDPKRFSVKTRLYLCEDHFNLEKDMDNYVQYKIMGSVKKIRLTPNCVPSKFEWQIPERVVQPKKRKKRPSKFNTRKRSKNPVGTSNSNEGVKKSAISSQGVKRPMIQIPLLMNQFAPPVDSETESESEFGSETILESTDEVLDNSLSFYSDHAYALSYDKQPKHRDEDPKNVFSGFRCRICKKNIMGFRYTCVQCKDFDMCRSCEAGGGHDEHYVLRVPQLSLNLDVQFVLTTIRRHLLKEPDPVADPNLDPEEIVKTEIKSESEDEMSVTIENDGFEYMDTSVKSEDEQDADIPSVRPVAVIRVNEQKDDETTRASQNDSMEFPENSNVRRSIRITMTDIPNATEDSTMPKISSVEQCQKTDGKKVKTNIGNNADSEVYHEFNEAYSLTEDFTSEQQYCHATDNSKTPKDVSTEHAPEKWRQSAARKIKPTSVIKIDGTRVTSENRISLVAQRTGGCITILGISPKT